MKELICVRNLSFSYPSKPVLKDISLTVSNGEAVFLMGPNGCGKTTLIDNILGLHKLQSGSVTLLGKDISSYKRHEIAQQIAYVPQTHTATFPYTVREAVLMGRTSYTSAFGKPSEQDEELCMKALEKVGIAHFADMPYSKLSGGEIKLVLLARALGQGSPIIIMDEPTASLDCRNELVFLESIAALCKSDGIAVLISTHTPDHAFYFDSLGIKTSAAMFADGTIAQYGSPDCVITEKSVKAVYGVNAKIAEYNGVKKILMLGTVN